MSEDTRFFAFLKDRIGLDVASVGEAIIERAVRQRCSASHAADSDAYWHLLNGSADEQQALIEAVIVPETWFFRYPESFATLGKLALARLTELAGARPLRILSLPCSTGEEPYSIAMALFDAGVAPLQFKVDAVDISPLSIQRARRGVYGKNSFRGDQLGFRDRYFEPVMDGFRLDERVADRVDFQPGNLLDPQMPLAQSAYDFVFCRNLLIYFDVPTQRLGFEALMRMTREEGVMFIGPAEGSLLGRMGMSSIGIPQSFAFRRRPDTVVEQPVAAVTWPTAERVKAPIKPPVSAPVRLPVRAPVKPLASAPASGASSQSGDASAALDAIKALANAGKTADAKAACHRYLQQYPPVTAVFYWLGLLNEVAGDAVQAMGFYRKALYLEPLHAETLAHMAALLSSQGDVAAARRLQERAARGANTEGRNR
ncbi:CheR family methyltransferase [Xanthomonas sp. WHRI 1810A]|uniref:CheR family methyltransferase n=1 Tax=Xanthomonas sp. WHRI 1810A TaxID=3161565 RepID=UPI0032E9099A